MVTSFGHLPGGPSWPPLLFLVLNVLLVFKVVSYLGLCLCGSHGDGCGGGGCCGDGGDEDGMGMNK